MSASLVGSEMCIRDRTSAGNALQRAATWLRERAETTIDGLEKRARACRCLLYTSDAADDM
eukprot:9714452-Alexandrium_andersonii.AAC.1